MSQAWEGHKHVSDLPEDIATPMIKLMDGRSFFVRELVQCFNDGFFLPRRWVIGANDEMYAVGDQLQKHNVSFVLN